MSFLENLDEGERVEELLATIRRLEKRLANATRKQDALVEAFYEAIHDGVTAISVPKAYPPPKDRRKTGDETAVLMLSDVQLGKRTESYDTEVAAERVRQLAHRAVSITEVQRTHHPVRRVAVFLLGDTIEGELIFPGQAHEIDSSMYHQVTVAGPEIVVSMLVFLSQNFEQVDVFAVPGNHGFVGGRQRKEVNPETNTDRMLYRISSLLTRDIPHINWYISDSWYDVADLGEKCKFLLFHGHQIRGWSNFPWYGVGKKLLGWRSLSEGNLMEPFDHAAFGHFHTPTSGYLNDIRWWCNGTTESHNVYAQEQLASMGWPSQWLLFTRDGFGVTAEYLIRLD